MLADDIVGWYTRTSTSAPFSVCRALFLHTKSKSEANEQRMVQLFGRDWQPEKKYNRKSCTLNFLLTDTSIRRTPQVGPCFSLLTFFDSL